MGEQAVTCPICGSQILDYGRNWACESKDCPQKFKVYKEMSGYQLTLADLVDICGGAVTEEHEFTSKAKGTTFKARLAWSSEKRKVEFKFQNSSETLKGVLCPIHNKELRASEKRYYCPTKISEGEWCEVGAWRTIGGHQLTAEELGQMLLGLEVGPWRMTKQDGSGTYMAMAHYDFDENKVKLAILNQQGGDGGQPATVPTVVKTEAAATASAPRASTGAESAVAHDKSVPEWVEVLPERAGQVAKLLDLGDKDSELILEAAIATVCGSRGKSAKDVATAEEANAVLREINGLAIRRKYLQSQFGDDGVEYYVLVENDVAFG